MIEKRALSVEEKQEILFEMLKDVDAFCRANNIPYSISDGTMLVAVRHGGFIPWDDDAAICMLRKDFDIFASTYRSEKFQMLYNTTDKDVYFHGGYIKINDPRTVSGNPNKSILFRHGVTLDIFPFEDVPEDQKERLQYMHMLRRIDNRLYHSQKRDILSRIKSRKHNTEEWWNILNGAVHNDKYNNSTLVGQSVCVKNDNVVLEKKLFSDIIDIPFNGYILRGFKQSHEYLKFMFGEDYMTPKKWAHNDIVYWK